MPTYTIGGYLVLLAMRTGCTVLVEGPDDRRIISRAVQELRTRALIGSQQITIDIVDIAKKDKPLVGNRELVEQIHDQCSISGLRLAALVDREFRRFRMNIPYQDSIHRHHCIKINRFWTRGHSIENYFFDSLFVIAFLQMHCPEEITDYSINAVENGFGKIMRWAVAVSISAYSLRVLSRCQDIADISDWETNSRGITEWNGTEFSKALMTRGVDALTAQCLISDTKRIFIELEVINDAELDRNIAHGHIGWDVMWTGVAHILQCAGVSLPTVVDVARGHKDIKLRYITDEWVRTCIRRRGRTPLGLWAWLRDNT